MANCKMLEVTWPNGTVQIFPSLKECRKDTGWSSAAIHRCERYGSAIKNKRVKIRFLAGHARTWDNPRWRQIVSTHVPWNTLIGLKLKAAERGITHSELIRQLIFREFDEKELFELGKASEQGRPGDEFRSVTPRGATWNHGRYGIRRRRRGLTKTGKSGKGRRKNHGRRKKHLLLPVNPFRKPFL